jgi:hypothetical protein
MIPAATARIAEVNEIGPAQAGQDSDVQSAGAVRKVAAWFFRERIHFYVTVPVTVLAAALNEMVHFGNSAMLGAFIGMAVDRALKPPGLTIRERVRAGALLPILWFLGTGAYHLAKVVYRLVSA